MIDAQLPTLLERLTTHQDRALEVVARADYLLAKNDPSLAAELARVRWEMMRVVMPYAAFEHGELFPTLIAQAPTDKVGSVTALRDDCLLLGNDFKDYVAHWSSVSVAHNWDRFRPAAMAMAARLKGHIRRERTISETILIAARRSPVIAAAVAAAAR